jgi:multidrug resistance efflux pump
MTKLNKQEIRSPEMQEVMSGIPGRFLSWGLFLFFALILMIVVVSWYIRYPDVVTAPITTTTYNPPTSLVIHSGGKISKLFVGNEEKVTKNQPIVLIDNQADWTDIMNVNDFINSLGDSTDWQKTLTKVKSLSGLSLGEMQSAWLRFAAVFQKFKEYVDQSYIPSKLKLLEKQISLQEEYIAELKNQQILSEEDLRLTFESYKLDSGLCYRSNNSISISELERSKQALLHKQVSLSSLKSSLKNSESSSLMMRESLLDLKVQYEKELSQYKSDLEDNVQLFKVAIGQWKEKYLVESPIIGRIAFTGFWSENQVINPGEVLATVIPEDPSRIIVRAKIPISGLGRVKQGQEVNIKFTGYPYMEFGVIKGRISSVSLVLVDNAYIAEIELVNGMESTYNKEIGFINEMTGTAEIIIDNSRLIYRFIKPLKTLFRK